MSYYVNGRLQTIDYRLQKDIVLVTSIEGLSYPLPLMVSPFLSCGRAAVMARLRAISKSRANMRGLAKINKNK